MNNEGIAVPSNEISSLKNVLKYFDLWNVEYYFEPKMSFLNIKQNMYYTSKITSILSLSCC